MGAVPLWVFIVIAIAVLIMVLSVCLTLFICFTSRNNKGVEVKKDVEKEGKEKEKGKEKDEKEKDKDEKEKEKKSDKPKASEQPKTSENPSVPKVVRVKKKVRPKPSTSLPSSGIPSTETFRELFNDSSLTARSRLLSEPVDRGPLPSYMGLRLDPNVCHFPSENERHEFEYRILNGTNELLVYEIRNSHDYLEVPSNKMFGCVQPGAIHPAAPIFRSPHPYVEGEFFVLIFYDVVPHQINRPHLPNELMIYAYEHPERRWSALPLFTEPGPHRYGYDQHINNENEHMVAVNRHVNEEIRRRQQMIDDGHSTLEIIQGDRRPQCKKKDPVEIRVAGVIANAEQKGVSKTPTDKGASEDKSAKKKNSKKKRKSSSEESENNDSNSSSKKKG